VRPELGHGNHADLYSGVELLHHFAWLRISLFLLLASFLGNLALLFPEKLLRDPALPRLIRKLDSISLRLTPRERFVCRMRLRFSYDGQEPRAVAGAAMQLIVSAQSEL